MKNGLITLGVVAVLSLAVFLTPAESIIMSIPPTRAITKISIQGGDEIITDSYLDTITLVPGLGITILGDPNNDEITISATGGAGAGTNENGTALHVAIPMNKNDYLELYVGNLDDADDAVVKTVNIFALGM